jgi:methylmalonyl-CoA/ethylmalonyl-CoA epimerase
MPDTFTFHHVGVAVPDMEKALEFYASAFGCRPVSGPFEDPVQKVKVCFLADAPNHGPTHLELITPLTPDSPLNGYLARDIGAYHVCYQVENIAHAQAALRKKGCLIVSRPVPAVAFGGRKIAWCFTPTNQLVELLEK